MKDFFELREAYRKPTAAEIAADKAKDRKGRDTSDRYRNMKKKVYGNMMGGLKKEAVGDTALAFQTPQGTVTATKRNTKGMRGKQDGWSLSLKTKSGKVVDLGSHPNPTKANVLSIAKNATS